MIFLRLERGVSGEVLGEMGYKVTYLPRKARLALVKKSAAPKKRRRRKSKAHKRAIHRAQQKRYDLRFVERFGIEALRIKWREERRRQRAAKKMALVGECTSGPASPGGIEPPAPGPAPVTSL